MLYITQQQNVFHEKKQIQKKENVELKVNNFFSSFCLLLKLNDAHQNKIMIYMLKRIILDTKEMKRITSSEAIQLRN